MDNTLRELTPEELDAVSGGDKPIQLTLFRAGNSNQLFEEQHGNKTPITQTIHPAHS
jgi:hypothetical protein